MIFAAHQPNYLPWIGFFEKLARAERFVIVDHVQFERQNFQNRNRVKLADGNAHWLTVPVARGSRSDRIVDKVILHGSSIHDDWGRRTLLTLASAYARAPHYADYAPALEAALTRRWERLVDLNVHLIELCMGWLGISTPLVRSSTFDIRSARTGMIAEMAAAVGGDVYLSGGGGSRGYLDVEQLAARGVDVRWQTYTHPVYPQLHGPFVPYLSVLDLLFNCGPRSRAIALGEGVAALPPSVTAP